MSWESYEKAADRGPFSLALKLILLMASLMLVGGVIFLAVSWMLEPAQLAREEFGARTMLKRYEWFKDAAAQIDARDASLKVMEGRFESLKKAYGDTPRSKWLRSDAEQANLWEQEMAGMIAARNDLCSSYNAAMSKFNWQFCNVGSLPKGADVPLPREFKPYMTK